MIDFFKKRKRNEERRFYEMVSYGETKEAIEWINKNPKKINEKITAYGYTPFLTASYFGNQLLMDILIEKGANIHEKDKYGRNAAYIAVMNNQGNVVEKMYNLGVDIAISIEGGYSLLTLAAHRNHVDIIEFLVQSGIDVNAKADDGLDFLFFVEQGYCKVPLSFLLKRIELFNENNQKRIKKMRLKKVLEGETFSGTTPH